MSAMNFLIQALYVRVLYYNLIGERCSSIYIIIHPPTIDPPLSSNGWQSEPNAKNAEPSFGLH